MMLKFRFPFSLLVLAALALGFLARGAATLRAADAPVPAPTAAVAPPPGLHVIAAGDMLLVRLYDDGGLGEKSYRVDADGNVTFPLIGNVRLAGLTLPAAEDLIDHQFFSNYAVNPYAKIELASAGSPAATPASGATIILPSGEPDGWSHPVRGLRARLAVLPPLKAESPFCRVMLEFENVADASGQIRIRFAPERLRLQVTDRSGRVLTLAGRSYDGFTPTWEAIALPFGGTVRFQVSFPGLSFRPDEKVIVDAGAENAWVIPQDGTQYFLSGSLTIPAAPGDRAVLDWSGTIGLPKAEIPVATR